MNQSKETLEAYRALKRDLQVAIRKLEDLFDEATATGSMEIKADKIISSLPNGARFEELITEKVDLQSIINTETERLQSLRDESLALIQKVRTVKGKLILTEYYINGKSNYQIACEMHYDIRYIKKLKRKALLQIDSK